MDDIILKIDNDDSTTNKCEGVKIKKIGYKYHVLY